MKPLYLFILFVLTFALAQDELFDDSSYQKFFYLGTVNDNQVQLTLELRGNQVTGTYYYNLIGTPIELRGEQTAKSTETALPLTIMELDENGKAVAKFEGELSSTYQEVGSTFNGTWSCDGCASPEPKPFKLTRVAEFAKASFQQNRIETSLTYPAFLNELAVFNKLLNAGELINLILADFNEGQKIQQEGDLTYAWTTQSNIEIRYASENLVSLLENVWTYTGGAHGNYGFAGHTFLRDSDEVEVLEFSDLFIQDADLSSIAKFVEDDLIKQEASFIPENFDVQQLTDLSAFTLSPKGITFHFGPYAVGSYAEGAYEVLVPFEEVRDILRPEIASEFLG